MTKTEHAELTYVLETQGGLTAERNVAPIGLTPYYPILLKETGDKSKDSHLFFSFAGNLLDLSKT